MQIHVTVETPVSQSVRAKQVSAMFDVPPQTAATRTWAGEIPLDAEPWSVGLIVGPSGAGKSTLARHLFGDRVDRPLTWSGASVLDDFPADLPLAEITALCQAVGFNTIPAWLRPFHVLSTGEQFRVSLARRLALPDDPIVVDEFTSVVDRQVAQIGAHAVQKYVRRAGKRFVAVTCHYDVVDWLQPDWILEPATMTFTRRGLQRRPTLHGTIRAVGYEAWHLFAPYHYLTADLHRAARCYVLEVAGQPASFAGVLYRPHPTARDIWGVSRLVTLPDWQGLGLAFRLVDTLGAAYRALGARLHTYPAHPALVRAFDRSPMWRLVKRPGGLSATNRGHRAGVGVMGGRPNAVFAYVGPALPRDEARALVGDRR